MNPELSLRELSSILKVEEKNYANQADKHITIALYLKTQLHPKWTIARERYSELATLGASCGQHLRLADQGNAAWATSNLLILQWEWIC